MDNGIDLFSTSAGITTNYLRRDQPHTHHLSSDPCSVLLQRNFDDRLANFVEAELTGWHDGSIQKALYRLSNNVLLPMTVQGLMRIMLKPFHAWAYLFYGPTIIQDKFDKAGNKPFEIFAPDNRYVFVSSPQHIKELDNAPDTVLSLQAASKQMLQPRYTMHGFNWFDRRGTEGVGFIKALRTMLTNNLPQILPDLSLMIKARFEDLHSRHPITDGVRHSPVYDMIVNIVVLANAASFFGKDLVTNEAFMLSALAYIEETLICAEIVRLVPKFLAPLVGGIIARRLKSHETIFNALLPIAEERCQERDLANLGHKVPKHTITFAIHDLCLHPEYVDPLRRELEAGYADFEKTGLGLSLLDSFIKESARITPVESMSTRRHALQPFTLSDGTKVNIGDWACTPVRAIMMNPDYYPDAQEFNGFRFADPKLLSDLNQKFKSPQPEPSKLSDVNNSWHVWGTGRMACPGRFYAVAVMKLIMGQIIMNYECKLIDSDAPRWFTWRSSMLPSKKTKVAFIHR
ncbi:hypothetical protein FQN57_003660 [Myotisia sp. PD_48]|nr:hypothetical protein FQN57_003660 [Myotisia sp. PD_48]